MGRKGNAAAEGPPTRVAVKRGRMVMEQIWWRGTAAGKTDVGDVNREGANKESKMTRKGRIIAAEGGNAEMADKCRNGWLRDRRCGSER